MAPKNGKENKFKINCLPFRANLSAGIDKTSRDFIIRSSWSDIEYGEGRQREFWNFHQEIDFNVFFWLRSVVSM